MEYRKNCKKELRNVEDHVKQLGRSIGAYTSTPFFHKGLQKQCVEYGYECPIINSIEYGSVCPVENENEKYQQLIKICIEKCKKIKDELEEHIYRLQNELEFVKENSDENERLETMSDIIFGD